MEQQKIVVFVGGAHASGKTFLCRYLADKYGWMVCKQRHILIEIGVSMGLSWEQIAPDYGKYIGEIGEIMATRFRESVSPVLLIDCHYAIRSGKALRLRDKKIDEEYIHDLDLNLIAVLGQQFSTRFVLVTVEPLAAVVRFEDRPENLLDCDHTFYGSIKQSEAERKFFSRALTHFRVPLDFVFFVNNSDESCHATKKLETFCLKNIGVST